MRGVRILFLAAMAYFMSQALLRAAQPDSLLAVGAPANSFRTAIWSVTDSSLLYNPHGNTGQILNFAPGPVFLSSGGYGQPCVVLSGTGDFFGIRASLDHLPAFSYLMPFFDAQRFSWPGFQKISLVNNSPGFSGNPFEMDFKSIFVRQARPFARVDYITRDFGRDEVFALFAKQIRPGLRFQAAGGLGKYGGFRRNSDYNFQQTDFQLEKNSQSGKRLHLNYFSCLGQAGFPGPVGAFGSPLHPRLRRKVGESLFQGRLVWPVEGRFRHEALWQLRYLSEEWTNHAPFEHRLSEEWTGRLLWYTSFRLNSHLFSIFPSLNVTRLNTKNRSQSVLEWGANFQDRFNGFRNWTGTANLEISGGNFGLFRRQVGLRFKKRTAAFPELFVRFTHQTGGFVPPVFRDSTSYNREWLKYVPLSGQFQPQDRQKQIMNFREGMVLPVVRQKMLKISALASAVQWLKLPGEAASSHFVHAGNLSLWGNAGFLKHWAVEGAAGGHFLGGNRAQLASALPLIDAWGSLSFHDLFFRNDLDATFKILFQYLGKTEFTDSAVPEIVTESVRQPVSLLHLYGYFNVADIRFFLSFENLLNRQYSLLPGYPASGRTFRTGLVWDFWN